MNASGKNATKKPAPFRPIIDDSHAPVSARIRDVLLTLIAWLVLCWFLRDVLLLGWNIGQYLLGLRREFPPTQSRAIVDDLVPFFRLVGLFVAWLLLFGWLNWRRLQARRAATEQPLPLEPERHCAQWNLDAAQVAATRAARRSIARHDDKGRLIALEPAPTAAEPSATIM